MVMWALETKLVQPKGNGSPWLLGHHGMSPLHGRRGWLRLGAMGIDRIRVRQYAPSITRPNQPDVQASDWTEPGIEDYEIHTGAISDHEDPRDRALEFNQQTDMRKPDLVLVVPGELTFQIKTFRSVCTCGKSFQHSQVNSSYVARKYLQDFGKNPKWEVAGVQHHVRDLYLHLRSYSQKLNIAASTEREFERRMEYLKGLNEKAWKWLSKIPAKQWCKAYFTKRVLSDCLVNNISESFNAMILLARDKPILSMLEWIRVRLMTRLHTKRIGMEKYGGSVCPNVQDKLEKLKMESRSFFAMPSGRFKYEVDNYYERHVVDLSKKECSCKIWDLIGIPCKYGVVAIYKNLEHPEDYLHDCYLKEAYLDVYREIIHPTPGQDEWIKSGHLPPQPPHVLRPLGRPKKLRRRDPDEPRNPHKAQGGSYSATNQGNTSSQPPSSQPQLSQPATRSRSAQWFSSTQPTTHAPRETWHSRASSSQPVSVRDSIARGTGSVAGRARGVGSGVGRGRGATSGVGSGAGRGSGAVRGRGATCGVGSGAVRGRGATCGVGSGASRGRGVTSGVSRGRGVGRGSNSGAGMGSTNGAGMGLCSGEVSGAGRGSICGEASGASRSWTNGAAVKNLGEKRTRGNGSSRPPKLPVGGGKGK
uniref:SWIM-type domain-containing protein n=1 Tax=Fagus sylvatica TaxID=28930 RepID=A0A2N9G1J5_FAGSY